eukprot:9478542-Pyramimonas_sp.AAC.1
MPLPLVVRLHHIVRRYGCIVDGVAAISDVFGALEFFDDVDTEWIQDSSHLARLIRQSGELFLIPGCSKRWPKWDLDVLQRLLVVLGIHMDDDAWTSVRLGCLGTQMNIANPSPAD